MIMAFFGWFDYDYAKKIIIVMIIDTLPASNVQNSKDARMQSVDLQTELAMGYFTNTQIW